MKQFFSVFVLSILFMASISAQTQTIKIGKNDVSLTSAGYSISIDGQSFPIYKTSKGSECIVATSKKTGNSYGVWIGTPQDGESKTSLKRVSKSGKQADLIISKSGNPYMKYRRE